MATLSDLRPPQIEILQLVTVGLTNKTIDAEVLICEKTVEFHRDHAHTKMPTLLAGILAIQQGMEAETREIPS